MRRQVLCGGEGIIIRMMLHATGVMMPQKRIKMKTMMMIIIVMMMVAMVDDDAAGDAGGGGLVVIVTSAEVNRIEGSATAALRTGFVHKYPMQSLRREQGSTAVNSPRSADLQVILWRMARDRALIRELGRWA